jgi:hypothetical protein
MNLNEAIEKAKSIGWKLGISTEIEFDSPLSEREAHDFHRSIKDLAGKGLTIAIHGNPRTSTKIKIVCVKP